MSDQVTREDLKAFPHKTADIILEQQKRGWRGSMQSNGHVSLLAPDGETRLTVSRNPNSAWYLTEELTKYYRKKPVLSKEQKTVDEKILCPRPGCSRTYNSLEKLNIHIGVDHDGLFKCPECDELFPRATTLGWHRSAAHGYVSPNRAKRQAQEKARRERLEAEKKNNHQAAVEATQPTHVVLDERESWVIDLTKFEQLTIQQLQELYQASGLGMEVRIWKLAE